MELRHLRYFVAVAEESTLVAAARRLRIAQPALTRQIHDLEREIGVELFERGAHGVKLTPAGDVCLLSARHILRQVDVAIRRARGSSEGVVGRCGLCVGARGLGSGLVARIVARVRAEYPAIEVVVTEGVGARQWRALQLLEADIGLGFIAPPEYVDLTSEAVDFDVFDAVLLSTSHALAQRESLALNDLRGEPFFAWASKQFPDFARRQKAEFTRVGFKPVRIREFTEVYSATAMVAAGQGWTVVPNYARGVAVAGTTIVPLTDFKMALPHAILSRRDEQRPVVRTVIGVIRRLMTEERIAAGRGPDAAPAPTASASVIADATDEMRAAGDIELRHLRYFCAVVTATTFGRAAEQLELTQPALSRQVGDLERAVGLELLERTPRGVTATAAGESLFRSARRILDEASALPAEAQRARRGMAARCVVAAVPTALARSLLRDLVLRCADEVPQLEFVVEDYHTPKQPAALRSARVDIGLCHATPLSPIDERGLRRERLVDDVASCALVSADSPLASRSAITFPELADIPFLFANRAYQPALYDQLFAIFDGRSFRPRIEHTYDGIQTVWALVAEGRGWGIGFQSQCANPPPGTVAVPVSGFAMPWGVDVLYREDESRTLILLVLEMLHDIAQTAGKQSAVA